MSNKRNIQVTPASEAVTRRCPVKQSLGGLLGKHLLVGFFFIKLKCVGLQPFEKGASTYPANISTSDQHCLNVMDQRWNNVDPALKMKQNPTKDFPCYTKLIQRLYPYVKTTSKQGWSNVDTTISWRCFNVVTTIVKSVLKPMGIVILTDS